MTRLTLLRLALYSIVTFHTMLIVTNILAVIWLLVESPWYISIPLVTWLVNLPYAPIRCPLTTLENVVRYELGMPKISSFMKEYLNGK